MPTRRATAKPPTQDRLPDIKLFFGNCDLWKKLVYAIGNVVVDLNFLIDEDGIRGQGYDEAKQCYVDLKINSEGIDEYDCLTPSRLGMPMRTLSSVMKIGFKGDRLTMTHFEADNEDIHIKFESPERDRNSEFEVKLINQDSFENYPNPPNLDLSADFIVEMQSDTLHKIIKAYNNLSNTGVQFRVSETIMEMEFLPDVINYNGKVILNVNEHDPSKVKVIRSGEEELHTQTFTLNPWMKYLKGHELCERVKIHFEDRKYAVLEYDLGEAGYLRFWAAPREEDLTQTFSQSQE